VDPICGFNLKQIELSFANACQYLKNIQSCQMLLLANNSLSPGRHGPYQTVCFRAKGWRSKMKTLIAALALLSLAAGPVFAQTIIQTPQSGYRGVNPNSPALTGGGSLGHNRLQQEF
jgi:hypothetical protein